MIKIKVDGSVVSVQETDALYCGSQDVYTCNFDFDTSWERFSKSAVFRADGKTISVLLDEENRCDLPWELLVRGNIGEEIKVGVYGISAESEILTSVWDSLGMVREGSELGNDAREPSAGVYEQVMANLMRVDDKIGNYNEEVRSLVQRAESAAAQTTEGIGVAKESAEIASVEAQAAERAYSAVRDALDNLPQGGTLVINDLTTGGTAAALSAEMGKVLGKRSNRNLLHNWDFKNPVNQRGQTEYTATGYTIDRWRVSASSGGKINVRLTTDGVELSNPGTAAIYFQQYPENPVSGAVTLSVLCESISGAGYIQPVYTDGTYGTAQAIKQGLTSVTYPVGKSVYRYLIQINKGATITLKAVKLEMGETQTLAHQDNSGNWVLNEVPDYAAELAKCQRYYQLFASEEAMPTALADYRPSMRINPAVGTIEIGGVTYYYADANL